jgi:hypothetical protein
LINDDGPHNKKTEIKGRGIFPDKEISTTLEDRLKENDPELNWILNGPKNQQQTFQK